MATIITGDLNCKHPEWNSKTTNKNDELLFQYSNANNLNIIGPVNPTYFGQNNNSDILDIAILKNLNLHTEIYSINDLSSDHNPIFLEIGSQCSFYPKNYVTVNWHKFPHTIEQKTKLKQINNILELNEEIEDLKNIITSTINQLSSVNLTKNTNCLPAYIKKLIYIKNKASKIAHRTHYPQDKRTYNHAVQTLRNALNHYKNKKWKTTLEKLNPQDNSIWKIVKALKNKKQNTPPIHGIHGIAYAPEDKAEAFADSIENQFTPNDDIIDDETFDRCHRIRKAIPSLAKTDPPIPPTLPDEIQNIIQNINLRKARVQIKSPTK